MNSVSFRSPTPTPIARALFALPVALLLIAAIPGCSGTVGHSDLEQFVNEVKGRKGGRIAPMPEFKTYESFDYSVSKKRDPFTPTASTPEARADNGIRPDAGRHKESLEQFPLDTLVFAGHLERDGKKWAIVTAPDGLVYRVQEGNFIGQNYGEIVAISENEISIVEIVPDGVGGWIERQAALALGTEE